MIITMARASDQIRRGLNNRSQWGCHCLLFWCVHCDEAENVPCSLTYRLLLIYSSVAHLPCHPPHMTRFGKREERDKRELSHRETIWSLLKLDSDNILLERDWMKVSKLRQRLSHPAATGKTTLKRWLWCVRKWKRQKYRREQTGADYNVEEEREKRGGEKTNSSHHR